MTIAEIRSQLKDLAGKIAALHKAYVARRDQRNGGDEKVELWPGGEEGAERKQWVELNKRYDELTAKLAELEEDAALVARAAEVGDWLNRSTAEPNNRPQLDDQLPSRPGTTYGDAGVDSRDVARAIEQRQVDLTLCFQTWAARGTPARLTDAHLAACQRQAFDPSIGELACEMMDTERFAAIQRRMRDMHPELRGRLFDELLLGGNSPETRALAGGIGSTGGYISTPASVVRSIELAQIEFGAFLAEAQTITTQTGEPMAWPVGDDIDNEASYTDENVETTNDADPGFEAVQWRSHDLQSGFVKVPFRLFRDSFVNIELLIGRMIGERFGRKFASEATNGTSKIQGIIPRSPVGQTAAAAGSITHADIVGLEHSVDPAYRGRLMYMFHDFVLEQLRLLTDSQNRPLWISNIAVGAPDTLNGRRYVINQKMDNSFASTKKSVAAGDLSAYKWRRVGPSLRLKRLVERFAEFDQTAFIGYQSADGNLLRPNRDAACPVQVLQHP